MIFSFFHWFIILFVSRERRKLKNEGMNELKKNPTSVRMLYIWYSFIHYLQSSSGTWKCLVKFVRLFSFLVAHPSPLQSLVVNVCLPNLRHSHHHVLTC